MVSYRINTLLFLFSTIFVSCSTPEKTILPDWNNPSVWGIYNSPKYLTGLGVAQIVSNNISAAYKEADYNAFSEISNKILSNIKTDKTAGRTEIRLVESKDNGLTEQASGEKYSKAVINISSSIIVSGLSIIKRYVDEKNKLIYSLGILDREKAVEEVAIKLNEINDKISSSNSALSEYIKSGRLNFFLNETKILIQLLPQKEPLQNLYTLLKPSYYPSSTLETDVTLTSILHLLRDVLSRISLEKIEGDNQKGILDRPLSKPLSVKLIYKDINDILVSGLRVDFNFITGEGDLTASQRTDEQGISTANVTKLKRSSNNKSFAISVGLNLNEFIDNPDIYSEFNKVIEGISTNTTFNFTLKTINRPYRVLLVLNNNSGVNEESYTGIASSELRKYGFQSFTENDTKRLSSDRIKFLIKQEQYDKLANSLQIDFDYLVIGDLSFANGNEYQGMINYSVDVSYKAISLKDGKLQSESFLRSITGFGLNDNQAKLNAVQNGWEELARSFVSNILSEE
ncbi:MAG: hypothetical protein M1480_06360 [Bacteroidetes bacterium]|nr:hypothetical protein [Bacteroidota bacterium]MCL5028628.1 hypothetical protein [Bacteroidota bacterium]